MKQRFFNLQTFAVVVFVCLMFSLSACRQTASKSSNKKYARVSQSQESSISQVDSFEVADSVFFTYEMAMEIVQPGYKCDEKFISTLFSDLNLSMQLAERYISDADYDGDSPAISYCWGENVQYEDYKFTATASTYFGVNFNFFFDESRKTGFINRFSIITSSQQWYQQFMKDANNDGLRFVGNVDPAIYGKKGKMYQKDAGDVENSTEDAYYYVYDYSTDGKYDVEIGFDNGIDI